MEYNGTVAGNCSATVDHNATVVDGASVECADHNGMYLDEDTFANNITVAGAFVDFFTSSPDIIEVEDRIPVETTVMALFFGIPLLLCGILGNGPLIVCIVRVRQLRTTTNYIVLSRAVIDLVMILGLNIWQLVTYACRTWRFGAHACLFMMFMVSAGMTVCLAHTVTIAFTRYLFIVNPSLYRKLGKPLQITALFLLLYGLPISLIIPLVHEGLQAPPGSLKFQLRGMYCMLTTKSSSLMPTFAVITLGLVLMVSIFIRSYMAVIKSRHSDPVGDAAPGARTALLRRELTFISSVCVIFLVFLVTYLPWPLLLEIDAHSKTLPWNAFMLVVILSWVSSSTNWLILISMNKSFRKAFRALSMPLIHSRVVPEIKGPPPRFIPQYPTNRGWVHPSRMAGQDPRY